MSCYSASPVIIRSQLLDGRSNGIYLESSSARIEATHIQRHDSYGIYSDSSSPIIRNNPEISDNSSTGVYAVDSSLELTGNTIARNGYGGIGLESGAFGTIDNNTLTGNSYYGMYVWWAEQTVSVTNNTISDNKGDGISWGEAPGNIEHNTITGNTGCGIVTYDPSAVVADNTISTNGKFPISAKLKSMGSIGANSGSGNGTDGIEIQASRITTDTRWTKTMWSASGFPYIITGLIEIYPWQTSDPTPTLRIDPGVELQFAENGGIRVGYAYKNSRSPGVLYAKGTSQAPIRMTSGKSAAQSGDWQGIEFVSVPSELENVLEHVVVEYAAGNITVSAAGKLRIANSRISRSSAHGIELTADGAADITGNILEHNAGSAVSISGWKGGKISGNRGSQNGLDAVEIRSGKLTGDAVLESQPLPYRMTGSLTVCAAEPDAAAPVLTVLPDVTLEFSSNAAIYVGGYSSRGALSAIGEEYRPVTFTAADSSSVWNGLVFRESADAERSTLAYCVIEHAGSVRIEHSAPTIEHSVFRDNTNGIVFAGQRAAPVIRSNDFLNNDVLLESCHPTSPNPEGVTGFSPKVPLNPLSRVGFFSCACLLPLKGGQGGVNTFHQTTNMAEELYIFLHHLDICVCWQVNLSFPEEDVELYSDADQHASIMQPVFQSAANVWVNTKTPSEQLGDIEMCAAANIEQGSTCEDSVIMTAMQLDMDIHHANSSRTKVPEEEEETRGAFTVVNRHDTDADGIVDHVDDFVGDPEPGPRAG